jgi:hypothetical protein
MLNKTLILFFLTVASQMMAQGPFAPPAGQEGSSAIHKDSDLFKGWAVGCEVINGFKDISNPELGFVNAGSCIDVLGKSGERGTLSLGDGGSVILTFDPPITNGLGWDFAVFENGFEDDFLELAFVEVSSDGNNFHRFPAVSLTDTEEQVGPFGTLDATLINNLAGKYRLFYGVPFDLEELKDVNGLDVTNITHLKIIDVVGSINEEYASYDSNGNIINDPWPTPFMTGGFDLDAVGVINSKEYENPKFSLVVKPNPANSSSFIKISAPFPCDANIRIYNLNGISVWNENLHLSYTGVHFIKLNNTELFPGLYLIKLQHPNGFETFKMIML